MEIIPGVYSIPASTGAFMGTYPPNVYLVTGGESALIDTGYGEDEAVASRLDYLKNLGCSQLAYIIVTHAHPDHLGGAEKIKEAVEGRIALHSQDVPEANKAFRLFQVDRALEDGETIDLQGAELEIIHTPGHSPGHICLYLKGRGVLFSGDHILGAGTTAISPRQGDMAQYIDSLRKLLAYDLQMICPAHGPVVRQPQRKIEELIQHRLEREEQILGCLREGKNTIEEMVGDIYPELDKRLYGAAQGQVLAHLIKLERGQKVVSSKSGEENTYALR